MKNIILLFPFLVPAFLFAQYPTGSNKSRLGWQTTGDGLIWRGVAGDTVNKPNNRNYPYFQLDTVNSVLYRYIQTRGKWQEVGGGVDIDSLIYATRYWVNSNFFPLQGGTLTGTGGNGFVGFPIQSSPPSTPATGFSLYAGSTGNNISWMQPDGFFRRLVSPVTGTPRQYQFMARSYTLADSADVAALPTGTGTTNYYAKWSSSTALGIGNLFDNNTYVGILNSKPFSLGQWTTAGRPSGVTGYTGYNTTTAFTEGYFTSQWENYITSTGSVNGQVSIFSSAGKTYGTNNLFWDNSNIRLGIGTATPSVNLDVFASTDVTRIVRVGTSSNGASSEGAFRSQASSDVNAFGQISKRSSGFASYKTITNNDYYIYNSNSSGDISILNDAGGGNIYMTAGGSSTSQFTILANGFVGINTATPSYKFDVNDSEAMRIPRGGDGQRPATPALGILRYNTTGLGFEGHNGTTYFYLQQSGLTGGVGTVGSVLFLNSGGRADQDNSNFYFDDTNNRLGILTTSPGQDIDVNGDAYIRDSVRIGNRPKMSSNQLAVFDINGWVGTKEQKRDTTIYVTDADYNFSAAITSANILNRYNRIVIYSKLSASSTSDNQIFLHTPSSDFLQCEIIIYSNDASADADATSIDFTTNGAVDGAGGTVSSYGMSAGQRVNIRAVDDSGYKWFFN